MNPIPPEAGARQTVLFALLRQYLNRTPFEPFRIITIGGRAYDIPTADHAVLHPMLRQVLIADDFGGSVDVHTLHISSIEKLKRRRSRSAKAA